MIDRLVQILAHRSELSSEEILDVLWLTATKYARREAAASANELLAPADTAPEGSGLKSDNANDAGVSVPADGPDNAGQTNSTGAEVALHLGGNVPGADDEDANPTVPATEVAFGAPRPIRDPLTLPMALRRLRRIRAPGPVVTVDIDATVEATADAGGRLMTILTRPLERALDLALVIDGAPTMDMWAGTFDELERLLAQTGAFRSVSRWTLHLSGDAAQLQSRDGRAQPPRRLNDPSGRRVLLLATDARDEAWYSAAPWDMLGAWCAAMPTALLHVLPQHYWSTTAVGDPYVAATALRPAAPNSQYVHRLAWWADDPGGIPLPVVTLSPQAMETWAQVVAGGTTWATGITAVRPAPDSAPLARDGADPLMLVNDFRSRASIGAQRLARILASAATLSMPLVEVLQDRLAPETGVLERAEVLASGMLTLNRTADGQALLRYRPGIPEILRRGATTFEEWDTYAAISQYLEDRHRLGGRLHALVADPAGTARLDAGEAPFAALHENLAIRLGLRDSAANRSASSATSRPSESADQVPDEAEQAPRDEAGSPVLDEARGAAARSLDPVWVAEEPADLPVIGSAARWVEVHRLAVAGQEAVIARDVGSRLGELWLARSRFADVARLAELTLTLGEDARASYQLGWARDAIGDRTAALAAYDQALRRYRAAGDRGNEAATLSNIGAVYRELDEPQRALEYYGQALPITREIGNRAGEAATLSNIGAVYRELDEPQRALEYYGQALPITREIGNRAGEAATLSNIGAVYRELDEPQRALEYYGQALPITREIGNRAGEAATLSNIGAVYRELDEPQRALEYYGQALPITREIGNRAGEAVTRYHLAMIHRAQGEVDRAVAELEQVVELDRQVGHPDLQSNTETLHRLRQELASSDPGRGSR